MHFSSLNIIEVCKNSFPDYKHLLQENYVDYKYFFLNVTQLKNEPFYYQLMHIMLKNTELLKYSKITLQHVSVYAETIFR